MIVIEEFGIFQLLPYNQKTIFESAEKAKEFVSARISQMEVLGCEAETEEDLISIDNGSDICFNIRMYHANASAAEEKDIVSRYYRYKDDLFFEVQRDENAGTSTVYLYKSGCTTAKPCLISVEEKASDEELITLSMDNAEAVSKLL